MAKLKGRVMKNQDEDIIVVISDLEEIDNQEQKDYEKFLEGYAEAFERILNNEVLPCWNT